MSGQPAQQSYLPLDNGHHHTPPVMNAPSHTIINVNTQPSKSVVFVGGGCPSCRVCDFTNILLRIVNNLYVVLLSNRLVCCPRVIVLFVAFCGQFFFSQSGCYVSAAVRRTAVPIARTLKIDAIGQQVSLQ